MVHLCADAAAYAYEPFQLGYRWNGYQVVGQAGEVRPWWEFWRFHDRAVLLRKDDDLVLAFRGTVSRYISDWLTNLAFPWIGRESMHIGFAMASGRLKRDVQLHLQTQMTSQNPPARLLVTGHSKGAGMACAATLWPSIKNQPKVALITFSEPPVVNSFTSRWTSEPATHLVLVNSVDLLPSISLFFPSSRNCRTAVIEKSLNISHGKQHALRFLFESAMTGWTTRHWFPGISGHAMLRYRWLLRSGSGPVVPLPRERV
jgi:hypothetical protein